MTLSDRAVPPGKKNNDNFCNCPFSGKWPHLVADVDEKETGETSCSQLKLSSFAQVLLFNCRWNFLLTMINLEKTPKQYRDWLLWQLWVVSFCIRGHGCFPHIRRGIIPSVKEDWQLPRLRRLWAEWGFHAGCPQLLGHYGGSLLVWQSRLFLLNLSDKHFHPEKGPEVQRMVYYAITSAVW